MTHRNSSFLGLSTDIKRIYEFLWSYDTNFKSRDAHTLDFSLLPEMQAQNIEDLGNRLDSLKINLKTMESKTPNEEKQRFSKVIEELNNIKSEVENIKLIIYDNPEKSLTLPLINKDLEILKQENKALRSEINRVFDLSKWFIGTLIAMTVGLLGAIISIIVSKKEK